MYSLISCYISARVTEIDKFQRAELISLKDSPVPLKKKVPYDQLRPYMTSELHDINTNDTTPLYDNITGTPNDVTPATNDVTPLTDDTTPQCNNTVTPPNDRDKAHTTKKNVKNKGASVVPTKSQRCKKNKNQAALHCAANPNPEKLAETI